MARTMPTAEGALTILAATPSRLAELTDGAAPELLQTRPDPEEWSATEILAHLRACADMWGGAIARILAEERPRIRAINPRAWIDSTDYPRLAFVPSLRAFAAQRADLLSTLNALSPEGWARAATVTGAGKPLERTVLSYAARMAVHERPHVEQIGRIVRALRR